MSDTIQTAEGSAPETPTTTATTVAPEQQQQAAPASESKPDAAGLGGQQANEKPPAEEAPWEFKAPEGQVFDAKVLAAYGEAAKELELTQEAAQKLLDKVGPVLHQRQVEQIHGQIERMRQEWDSASRSHPEIGGVKHAETVRRANRAFDRFATPELRQLLHDTALNRHPEMLRIWSAVDRAMSPDTVEVGDRNHTPRPKSTAEVLFGDA